MNPIARLQTDLAAAQAALAAKAETIQEFRVHLDGSKFSGTDPSGSRRDWIASGDEAREVIHAGKPFRLFGDPDQPEQSNAIPKVE